MTSLTLVPSELLKSTTASKSRSIVSPDAPVPASGPANVVWKDVFRPKDVPAPPGFEDIDVVARRDEQDERRRSYLERARQRIAADHSTEVAGMAQLRLRLGWSQKRLADEIGTSQSHIARIEAGREDVLMGTARRLANALTVSIQELDAALLARGSDAK